MAGLLGERKQSENISVLLGLQLLGNSTSHLSHDDHRARQRHKHSQPREARTGAYTGGSQSTPTVHPCPPRWEGCGWLNSTHCPHHNFFNTNGYILYVRAIQGHSGGNKVDPSLQGNVEIPDSWIECRVFRWLGLFPTHDWDFWNRTSGKQVLYGAFGIGPRGENVDKSQGKCKNNASGQMAVFGSFWCPVVDQIVPKKECVF